MILGRIPEDFRQGVDLALGPWCFAGPGPVVPDWQTIEFPAAFADARSFHAAGEAIGLYCDHHIAALGSDMNARLGRNYSFGFWEILILPWLFRLAEIAFARFEYVRAFVAEHAQDTLAVEIWADEIDWDFRSMEDFAFRGLMHPDFHLWLNSQILIRLAPSHWILTPGHFDRPADGRIRKQAVPRFKGLRTLGRRLLATPRFQNVWGIGPLGSALFSVVLGLVPARRRQTGPDLSPDPLPALPETFLDLMRQLERTTRPAHLRDDFTRWEAEYPAARFRAGRLRVAPITWVNEKDLFTAAVAREAGEKIVSSQYGCHYGTALVFSFPARLQYRQFAFLTWGWTEQQDYPGRYVPLPSPYLSRHVDAHREERDDMVLVGTALHAFMVRLHAGPQPHEFGHYRQYKKRFIEAMGPAVRRHLTYRPHHLGDWDFEDMGFVRRIDPQIPEVGGNQFDLTGHLLGCRLLVLDNPGTTLHIAMAANVPTIGFWEKDAWQLCRQAQPIYDRMVAAGIVHHAPESAAAKIEAIWPDVQAWWQSAPVQDARAAFCREHARASRFWWWHWAAALARLSWSR